MRIDNGMGGVEGGVQKDSAGLKRMVNDTVLNSNDFIEAGLVTFVPHNAIGPVLICQQSHIEKHQRIYQNSARGLRHSLNRPDTRIPPKEKGEQY
jgi:hypothetical protein